MERSRPVVSHTRRLLLPIGTLPTDRDLADRELGIWTQTPSPVLRPRPLQKLTMSNSPQDGLSASKTHPTRPFRGRLGRRPRCEHGESLAHPHYVVNTRSRDVVIISCPKTGDYGSQPLLQEAHEAGRQEAGIACRLLDRVVEPVVRRALHDAGAHEEVGLLQSQQ